MGDLIRLEKLKLGSNSYSSIAKIVGTVVGIGGAMLFSFYRGPIFTIWSTHIDFLRQYHNPRSSSMSSSSHRNNPWLGFLAGLGSMVCFATWLIMQVIFHSLAKTNTVRNPLNMCIIWIFRNKFNGFHRYAGKGE